MLQIGVCDDLLEARFSLCAAVERILENRAVEYKIYEFSSGDGLLRWFSKHAGKLDLVFLDIEMDGVSGMETAKALRNADSGLQLVFVTGHRDYVFDGYSVGALGYLLKPVQTRQLEDVLIRALSALHLDADNVFLCRNSEGTYRIPKRSIRYFYSDRRQVTCVTDSRDYTFYSRLDDVARDAGPAFVRIHQRYLVNAAAVEQIETGAVHIGGKSLPVSRNYREPAMLALTRATLGHSQRT